jgi:hypothetical protein
MPGGRLVLHVGAMKSGTTYLQSLLFANRSQLGQRGILVPGKRWHKQASAVYGLLHSEGRQWRSIAERISSHAGTSVISMELLATARPDRVRALRESVDCDVDVVITARDLNRSIPAMWQEMVQNGRTWTWQEYLDGVAAERPGRRGAVEQGSEAGAQFWRQQNVVRIARTWGDVVGSDRVSVVTVPHPGAPRDLLWERFASVLGTEPTGMEPAEAFNESIGLASAMALRDLNVLLDGLDLDYSDSKYVRKRLLAKGALASRRASEPALGLPVSEWVVEQSARTVTRLRGLGVRLVGDWADLAPVAVPGVHPREVSDRAVADAALAGLADMVVAATRDPDTFRR